MLVYDEWGFKFCYLQTQKSAELLSSSLMIKLF